MSGGCTADRSRTAFGFVMQREMILHERDRLHEY